MAWNEEEQRSQQSGAGRLQAGTLAAAETLRNAQDQGRLAANPPKGEERIGVFWRVFGGTLLSIVALVCITVYQQFTSVLNELRNDVNRLNESRADLVKKEEFNSRMTSVWAGMKDFQGATTAFTAAKERLTFLEQHLKASEDDRKESVRELQHVRERLAVIEGSQGRPLSTPASLRKER
ncbi:MAG TPA: hypothetical protein VG013_40985 [Gemmataceae bacterium]|nr:hypothetical protein [Gemmataceae bacterium]